MVAQIQADQTDQALARFTGRLRDNPNVLGAWVLATRGGAEVRVLLERWTRAERFRVYEAHREADPDDLLYLRPTDNAALIPRGARCLLGRL